MRPGMMMHWPLAPKRTGENTGGGSSYRCSLQRPFRPGIQLHPAGYWSSTSLSFPIAEGCESWERTAAEQRYRVKNRAAVRRRQQEFHHWRAVCGVGRGGQLRPANLSDSVTLVPIMHRFSFCSSIAQVVHRDRDGPRRMPPIAWTCWQIRRTTPAHLFVVDAKKERAVGLAAAPCQENPRSDRGRNRSVA